MLSKLSAIAVAMASMTQAYAGELLISEYVEGSSNNKAVELYNNSDQTLDLSQYQLAFYFNGSDQAATTINLIGNLAPHAVYVVADDDASADIKAQADQLSGSNFFNGDDAIVLSKAGTVVDSLGQVGFDPGSQWGQGELSTRDNTLRRQVDQLVADVNPSDETNLSNWQGFAQDDVADLGAFNAEEPTDPTDPTEPADMVCSTPFTAVSAIQGSGASSPLAGQQVVVEGIVTSNNETHLNGFFIQSADNETDGDSSTSEGVFVYSQTPLAYQVGDRIRLATTVKEYNGLTELTDVTVHQLCEANVTLPSPASVTLPVAELSDFEAFEGMLVSFTQPLIVNEVYNLGRYGELLLGSQRHYIGTQVATPGADALAVTAANAKDSIILDDGLTAQNPDPIRYPAPELSASNTVRVGDAVSNFTAVMHYGFDQYRLMPIDTVNFVQANPRSLTPELAMGGNLKVASFNVLNYFNGDGLGGGFPTDRGADTAAEFVRQRDKIISAMVAIDADIYGLMEIENDGFDQLSAIADLVNGLNQAWGDSRYSFVSVDGSGIGTDAIAVGLIYRSDRLSVNGAAKVLSSANSPTDNLGAPLFNDSKNRAMLAQAFTLTNEQQDVVVAVNHLKSKGSDCDSLNDPNLGDGQGNCNVTRTRAAQAIGLWMAEHYPEQAQLVLGDLNAYAKEDPLAALDNAGFIELNGYLAKPAPYSYIFKGETGQLDYALANTTLLPNVIDVVQWPINSDEPRVLDYNEEFKTPAQLTELYQSDAYRSSDHDPVIVSLQLQALNVPPTADFTAEVQGLSVTLTAQADDVDGQVAQITWQLGDGNTASGQMVNHSYSQAGSYTITMSVTDDDGATTVTEQLVVVEASTEQPPVASFMHVNFRFMQLFLSTSSDPDGEVVQQLWQLDNGKTSRNRLMISYGHSASQVTLTVTDNDGLQDTITKDL
ncbi:ExeM/NucH family extracellular endonuclease [Shewanella waksmanii]|uniref:ExeM/NucH family extracellular endonuclease n=1 Tax=Shewanella waksmanii TaxID=213783 RepID=UPI003736F0F1